MPPSFGDLIDQIEERSEAPNTDTPAGDLLEWSTASTHVLLDALHEAGRAVLDVVGRVGTHRAMRPQ